MTSRPLPKHKDSEPGEYGIPTPVYYFYVPSAHLDGFDTPFSSSSYTECSSWDFLYLVLFMNQIL